MTLSDRAKLEREAPWVEDRTDRRAPLKQRNIPSPNEAAKAYARFIPREELDSFAAWKPGEINGGPTPQPNVQRKPDEAPKVDIAAQLAERVRGARAAGYQDGYRDGLVALEGFKQSFAMQTTTQIGALLQSLGDELGGLQQDMARTLAIAATHLARQIVRTELVTRPELIATVAHEALDTLMLSARHITLRVHPDDHPLVAQGAADVLAARGARLLSDASMSRGGCLVESDIGVIDATLEARWRRAAGSLGCDESWQGDSSPAGETGSNGRADDRAEARANAAAVFDARDRVNDSTRASANGDAASGVDVGSRDESSDDSRIDSSRESSRTRVADKRDDLDS